MWPLIASVLAFLPSLVLKNVRWSIVFTDTLGAFLLTSLSVLVALDLDGTLAAVVAFVAVLVTLVVPLYDDFTLTVRQGSVLSAVVMNTRICVLLWWLTFFVLALTDTTWSRPLAPLLWSLPWLEVIPYLAGIAGALGILFLVPTVVKGVFGVIGVLEYLAERDRRVVTLS